MLTNKRVYPSLTEIIEAFLFKGLFNLHFDQNLNQPQKKNYSNSIVAVIVNENYKFEDYYRCDDVF